MQSPIDRLRDVALSLTKELRDLLVNNGCFAIGRRCKRNNEPWSDIRPYGELFDPLTIDDLCDEMKTLVEKQGMIEEFLIPAVVNFVIEHYERAADSEISNERLDDSLGMLSQLEHELALPENERRVPANDDDLRKMIGQLKDGMIRQPKFKEDCLDVAAAFRKVLADEFHVKYWEAWSDYRIREN